MLEDLQGKGWSSQPSPAASVHPWAPWQPLQLRGRGFGCQLGFAGKLGRCLNRSYRSYCCCFAWFQKAWGQPAASVRGG